MRKLIEFEDRERNLADLWLMIRALEGWRHPVLKTIYEAHLRLEHLPPNQVSEALSLANVYYRDPDLWLSYKWLSEHGKTGTFSGIGGAWPSHAERDAVRTKRA